MSRTVPTGILLALAIMLIFTLSAGTAQSLTVEWQITLGTSSDSSVSSLQKTADGYVLAGSSSVAGSGGNGSIFAARINETGGILWEHTYSGGLFSNGNGIAAVSDGFVIAGTEGTDQYPSGIATLLKVDGDGREIWRQEIVIANSTYSEANCVVARGDSCVVAGYSYAQYADPLYKYTLFLAEIAGNGTIVRVESFPDVFMYRPLSIQGVENGYMLAGDRYTAYEDVYSGFMAKINDSGGEEWVYQYKPSGYQSYFTGLQKVADDRYMAVGCYADANVTGAYLVTVNETGSLQTYNLFQNVTNGMLTSLTLDNDSVALSGWVKDINGSTNLLFAKTWPNGTTISVRGINDNNYDTPGYDIKSDGHGGYLIAGTKKVTWNASAMTYIYLLKIGATNTTSTASSTQVPSGDDFASATILLMSLAFSAMIAARKK